MSHFTIKAGDYGSTLSLTLLDDDGNPSDLTGIENPLLVVRFADGTSAQFTMQVSEDVESGVVTYTWLEGETDIVGTHEAEVYGFDDDVTRIWPVRGRFKLVFNAPLALPEED